LAIAMLSWSTAAASSSVEAAGGRFLLWLRADQAVHDQG
jgi:hypothetical protein